MTDSEVDVATERPTAPTQGVCIWLTGRSGAGKSTVTSALLSSIAEQDRVVTVLDTVPLLAKNRGEKTSEGKLLRKAFVASEVARHGGIAVCVTVSARREVRDKAREIVGADRFLEVYFDISPELAEARRRERGSRTSLSKSIKNILRPAARQLSNRYRGGYEVPDAPDVTVDTASSSPEESAELILAAMRGRGFL